MDHEEMPTEAELWEKTKSVDVQERADALRGLAHYAFNREEFDQAAAFHAAEADLFVAADNELDRGMAMYHQGICLYNGDRYSEALGVLRSAMDLYRVSARETWLADVEFWCAQTLSAMGKKADALDMFDSASRLYKSGDAGSKAGRALFEKGELLESLNRYAEAREAYASALTEFQDEEESWSFGRVRDRLAQSLIKMGLVDEALENLRENVDLFEFLEATERVMFSKYRVGWTLQEAARYQEALPLLREARVYYAQLDNYELMADIDALIVDALRALGEFAEADDIARRIRAYFKSTGNDARLVVSDINVAGNLFAEGKDFEAEALLWSVVERCEAQGFPIHRRIARLRLAEYFVSNDAFEQANSALASMLPEEWGEDYEKRVAHLNVVAKIALGLGHTEQARGLARRVIDVADLYGFVEENAEAHLLLAQICDAEPDESARASDYRAKAVALFLAGGRDNMARMVSAQLLPGDARSRVGYEAHRSELPTRSDTGPIETVIDERHDSSDPSGQSGASGTL